MPRIRELIEELSDDLEEATVVALADAVFILATSTEARMSRCLDEADGILERLRANGFDIVRKTQFGFEAPLRGTRVPNLNELFPA
jgi:hypothetical protein